MLVAGLSACTTIDEHYHAYMDGEGDAHTQPAQPPGDSAADMPGNHDGLLSGNEKSQVQDGMQSADDIEPADQTAASSSTSASAANSYPQTDVVTHAAPEVIAPESNAPVNMAAVPETAQWQYRPDSRDRNPEASEQTGPVAVEWHDPLATGYQPDRTHKALADYASQLAMQLMDSATELSSNDLIGVASFVRLNRSLQETTVMGNQLAELLIAELQSFGVGIVDFKMADALTVTPFGDLAMTRTGEIQSRSMQMDHILTGTLIEEPRGVRVNARIVSVEKHQVVASTSLLIPSFMVTALNSASQTGK